MTHPHSAHSEEPWDAGDPRDDPFRVLVASVKEYAIFTLDPGGHVVSWNEGAERIKGYSAGEIIGKHFSVFYPPNAVRAGKCDYELDVAASKGRFEEEAYRIRKDGSRFWASVTITAVRSPKGNLRGFVKVTRDLTERKAAEEAAMRFQMLIASVKGYAIFMLDREGRVMTWNEGAERIKGYLASEIIGKHFSVFYPPEVVRAGKCERELEIAISEGRFEDEGYRIRKDGSRFWANVTIAAVRDPKGELIGFAKVTQDLSEKRAVEEERRNLAAQKATLAEKEKTHQFQERFLAILGHDLRNPLASMNMGLGILGQRNADPAMHRILSRMGSSARRMSRMIEQILDLTRSRLADGLTVQPAEMELSKLLHSIVDEVRASHPSQAFLLTECTAVGRWDADRLEQVFSNLIGNAAAYGDPQKPISIALRIEGESAIVEVHNWGEPIPERAQATLFDPFRRADREGRSSKTEGLGLGLYISREIVAAHGGTIDVRSDAVRGTTFRAMLPLGPTGEKGQASG